MSFISACIVVVVVVKFSDIVQEQPPSATKPDGTATTEVVDFSVPLQTVETVVPPSDFPITFDAKGIKYQINWTGSQYEMYFPELGSNYSPDTADGVIVIGTDPNLAKEVDRLLRVDINQAFESRCDDTVAYGLAQGIVDYLDTLPRYSK